MVHFSVQTFSSLLFVHLCRLWIHGMRLGEVTWEAERRVRSSGWHDVGTIWDLIWACFQPQSKPPSIMKIQTLPEALWCQWRGKDPVKVKMERRIYSWILQSCGQVTKSLEAVPTRSFSLSYFRGMISCTKSHYCSLQSINVQDIGGRCHANLCSRFLSKMTDCPPAWSSIVLESTGTTSWSRRALAQLRTGYDLRDWSTEVLLCYPEIPLDCRPLESCVRKPWQASPAVPAEPPVRKVRRQTRPVTASPPNGWLLCCLGRVE